MKPIKNGSNEYIDINEHITMFHRNATKILVLLLTAFIWTTNFSGVSMTVYKNFSIFIIVERGTNCFNDEFYFCS